MPVQLSCPSCQRQLRVPDNLVGKTVKCPGCQTAFQAEVESAPTAPPHEPCHEDEPPRSSRRDDREAGYREESPAAPMRRRPPREDDDDDFDDDRPGRKRRRRNLAPHRGTLILVLGILGFVGGGIFTAIPAWIMGSNDLKEIRAGRMDPEGESNTNIGRILGMIVCILNVLILLICCPLWFIGILAGGAGK